MLTVLVTENLNVNFSEKKKKKKTATYHPQLLTTSALKLRMHTHGYPTKVTCLTFGWLVLFSALSRQYITHSTAKPISLQTKERSNQSKSYQNHPFKSWNQSQTSNTAKPLKIVYLKKFILLSKLLLLSTLIYNNLNFSPEILCSHVGWVQMHR